MWAWIGTAFSAIKGLLSSNKTGDSNMGNFASYAIITLVIVIISLCANIYLNRQHINELQNEVKNGMVALEVQNTMIESNRVKNENLNKELKDYVARVKQDFANIKIDKSAQHKEAQNQCEAFINDLAEAYQK